MSVGDTLKTHWKKLAIVGAVLGVGICVILGVTLSGDVEKPADAEIAEGGSAGAQHGDGGHGTAGAQQDVVSNNNPFKDVPHIEKVKVLTTKSNYQSNLFMQLKENPDMEITYDEKEYIVYLLNSNAGGQLLKNCFDRAATEDRNRPFLVTPTATAKLYEDARASKTLPNRVLMGENLLGICDIVAPASCSYFTILSDPIERIVSTYVQALSSGVLQEGESIKNWAFRQRDYFLNQLLQTAESCSEPNGDGAAEVEIAIQSHPDESLDVALIGITEWFKLVCNSADMTGCLRALQLAYGLDLSVCIDDFAGLKPAGKDMDPALAQLLEDQTTDGDYKGKTPLEKLKNKLQQDEEISDVMHADSQCYQKVVQTARIEDEEVDKRRRK